MAEPVISHAIQRAHGAYEEPARRPSEIGRRKIVREERHDDKAYEQRPGSAEIDGPACQVAPALEVHKLGACELARPLVELRPSLLDLTRAIYDAREPIGHDRE